MIALLALVLVALAFLLDSWVPIAVWIALWCLVLWAQAAPATPRRRRR